ncbi:hypothetical protein EV421DRAFT_1908000 [Armillaria borealis]|uniref:C2H2-type domain-containing protein n=1 Tax=Armillaria borealis TaxID=47425 RepID=A0AA39MJQ4_9AGAR|nr:hypothetical protein EV421DRAFT_1908000 [Armillaria borealis]
MTGYVGYYNNSPIMTPYIPNVLSDEQNRNSSYAPGNEGLCLLPSEGGISALGAYDCWNNIPPSALPHKAHGATSQFHSSLKQIPYHEHEGYPYANSSPSWPHHSQRDVSALPPYFPLGEIGAAPSSWSPNSADLQTPDLGFSSPALSDDCQNVFDLQFGHSISSASTESISQNMSYSSLPQDRSRHQGISSRFPSGSHEVIQHVPLKKPAPSASRANDSDDAAQRRRYPCLVAGCGRRFTSQYTLKVHTEAHKPKPRVSFPCTLGCNEWFSRQHDRLRHEVAKHNKICEFSCDVCGRFFSTAKTLGNHRCPLAQGETRWVHH